MSGTAYYVILTALFPLFGLYKGLLSVNYKGKLWIFTVFGFFYGLTINYNIGDSASHVQGLGEYIGLGLDEFYEMLIGIIRLKPLPNSPSDPYIHLLNGVAGSVVYSPNLYFAIVGSIYGYFYGRAMLKVICLSKNDPRKVGALSIVLIVLFVIHRSYGDMQTVRSWTGMWVLFNGVISYYETRKKKYLLLMAFAPFFHIMYGFIIIPAFLAVFAKRLRILVIALYFSSFFFTLDTKLVLNTAGTVEAADKKLGYYYKASDDENGFDPISERRERSEGNWYVELGKTSAVYLGSNIFMLFLIAGGYYRKEIMSRVQYGLMTTALLMATLANLLNFAYALYSRTMANASTYILAVMVLMALNGGFRSYKLPNAVSKALLFAGVLVFIPKIVYFMSVFLYQSSVFLIIMPVVRTFAIDLNMTFRDLIDHML